VRPVDLDSSAAAAETKSKSKLSKMRRKFSNQNFQNMFQVFAYWNTNQCVPSFVRIGQKTVAVAT